MKKPSQDFQTRYKAAMDWRRPVETKIAEIFKFCAPQRVNDFNASDRRQIEEPETFHSLPEELATDLAGDLVNYFTPAEAVWSSFLVTAPVKEEEKDEVLAIVSDREERIFDLITASNYNDIAPQWGFEAATHGTPAIWVQQAHIFQSMFVEVVPPHELLIVPGHMGILDRFREQTVPWSSIKATLNGWDADLSDSRIANKVGKPGIKAKLCWGFWVDWSDPGFPTWRMEIVIDGVPVVQDVTLGPISGACPLLVGRFNPQVGRPWGRGAAWKALPDIRTLDKVDEVVVTNLDDSLQNTVIYPDDGFLDMTEGVIPGTAYPAHRGFTRDQIYELQKGANLDYGFYSEERFEARLRTAFYQDGPRQTGDTPPTASQWLDERRRVQQRLGKPSAPLWTEMLGPFIQRVEFLAVESGELPEAITLNGRAITVQPISPLQKAQNQDQVLVARSNLALAVDAFQDQTMAVVDGIATFKNIVKTSGDKLLVIRDQEKPVEEPAPPAQ